jgi:hypothetical protein
MKKNPEQPQQANDEIKIETPKPTAKKIAKKIKTGGRQKGTQNKTTAQLKNAVMELVCDFVFVKMKNKKFKDKFEALDIDVQFALVSKLIPFVLAKQTETKVNLDEELTKAVKDSMDKINSMF